MKKIFSLSTVFLLIGFMSTSQPAKYEFLEAFEGECQEYAQKSAISEYKAYGGTEDDVDDAFFYYGALCEKHGIEAMVPPVFID